MLESFEEHAIYWMLGAALIMVAMTVFGLITSSHLPLPQRKMRIRKFAAIGAAIFFFSLPLFKPMVDSSSNTRFMEPLKAENLKTVEDLEKFERSQTSQIERMKEDILELKRDARRMNLYYSSLVSFLSMAIGTLALSYALRKKETNETGD
ncbi:MAG: hypothetical protein JSS81_10825 [Acidobacteria bacterium]|nr:hypothetical protein [Acidobacteriota bacterium]